MADEKNDWTKSRIDLERIIQETMAKQMNWVKDSTFSQIDATRTFLSSFQQADSICYVQNKRSKRWSYFYT